MSELTQISAAARAAAALQQPTWLATVVRVRGSAYRHAGARLLFSNDQALAGSVSGGCLEASIVRKGPWAARERPVCLRYEGGREDEDSEPARGSGCDGTVDILLEKADFGTPASALDALERCFSQENRCALATVFESSNPAVPVGARLILHEDGEFSASVLPGAAIATLQAAAARALSEPRTRAHSLRAADFEVLLEVFEPPPHLFVFGSGPDALPLVEFARGLGLGVTVCDPNPRLAVRERFSALADLHLGSLDAVLPKLRARRTPLAVVMSHHYPTDCAALRLLLDSPALYVGVLGPRRRTERVLGELFPDASELAERALAGLLAPIGLDLGAETAAQIALSIIAEIQAVLTRASAQPLSRSGIRPIHRPQLALDLPSAAELGRTGTA
ncbi:MAG: XdhC/CoxI family protein [Polyangiaceae bacterium]